MGMGVEDIVYQKNNISDLTLEAKSNYFDYLHKTRGRGFASDKEAWAELKAVLESIDKRNTAVKKLHKEIWETITENNEDSFSAYIGELERTAYVLAVELLELAAMADMAAAGREI